MGWKAEDVAVTHVTPSRPVMPMSERQQIALLMQISSPSPPGQNPRKLSDYQIRSNPSILPCFENIVYLLFIPLLHTSELF